MTRGERSIRLWWLFFLYLGLVFIAELSWSGTQYIAFACTSLAIAASMILIIFGGTVLRSNHARSTRRPHSFLLILFLFLNVVQAGVPAFLRVGFTGTASLISILLYLVILSAVPALITLVARSGIPGTPLPVRILFRAAPVALIVQLSMQLVLELRYGRPIALPAALLLPLAIGYFSVQRHLPRPRWLDRSLPNLGWLAMALVFFPFLFLLSQVYLGFFGPSLDFSFRHPAWQYIFSEHPRGEWLSDFGLAMRGLLPLGTTAIAVLSALLMLAFLQMVSRAAWGRWLTFSGSAGLLLLLTFCISVSAMSLFSVGLNLHNVLISFCAPLAGFAVFILHARRHRSLSAAKTQDGASSHPPHFIRVARMAVAVACSVSFLLLLPTAWVNVKGIEQFRTARLQTLPAPGPGQLNAFDAMRDLFYKDRAFALRAMAPPGSVSGGKRGYEFTLAEKEAMNQFISKYPVHFRAFRDAAIADCFYIHPRDVPLLELPCPNFGNIGIVARCIATQGEIALGEGRTEDAMEAGGQLIRFADNFQKDGLLVQRMIAVAVRGIGLRVWEEIVDWPELQPSERAAVAVRLRSLRPYMHYGRDPYTELGLDNEPGLRWPAHLSGCALIAAPGIQHAGRVHKERVQDYERLLRKAEYHIASAQSY